MLEKYLSVRPSLSSQTTKILDLGYISEVPLQLFVMDMRLGNYTHVDMMLKNYHKQFQQDNVDQMSTFQQVFVLGVDNTVELLRKSGKQLYLIQYGKQTIGFLSTFLLNQQLLNNAIAISDFFIDKSYRGRGFGRLVLSVIVEFLFSSYPTIDRIGLSVLSDNVVAKSLYSSMGFSPRLETLVLEKDQRK